MPATAFPEVTISGDARDRGYRHGQCLAQAIAETIAFYARIFRQPRQVIFQRAEHFKRLIQNYRQEYAIEIEAIAEGADVDPLWIYALNSRTELLSLDANECTALYFQRSGILGQNWDWGKALEGLAVVLRIQRPDGHRISMLTEPGIIGKIGMNSVGIGVCLNILRLSKTSLDGLPIHIVLRAILDARTLEEARQWIAAAGFGKASNIMLGTADGRCLDVEFAGDEAFVVQPENGLLIHTNHYLVRRVNPDRGPFRSSYARLRAARQKTEELVDDSITAMKSILLDRSNAELPIHRGYVLHPDVEEMGTVATLIMELKGWKFHIKKGNGSDAEFRTYVL